MEANFVMGKRYYFYFALMTIVVLTSCTSFSVLKPKTSYGLVQASLKTLNIIKQREDFKFFEDMLKDAAGVAIFPSLYKAGFFVGAEGGNGILVARDTSGTWGYPAFYTLASGSWGIQFGGQKAGVILVIRNKGAVEAILKHQGKFGADLGIALGPIGVGLEGATTTNLAADIYAFSDAKGLFGGVSLEGTAIIRRNDLNEEYYGSNVTPASILMEHANQNAQADLLRASLITH